MDNFGGKFPQVLIRLRADSGYAKPWLYRLCEQLDVEYSIGLGMNNVLKQNSDELLKKARKKKLEVLSDIELFAREAKAPFAAVTGSNGKSTVTELVGQMCARSGRPTFVGGNLGTPLVAQPGAGYVPVPGPHDHVGHLVAVDVPGVGYAASKAISGRVAIDR